MVRPQEMDEILRQIGWADGFNIPAISDENRELELEVFIFVILLYLLYDVIKALRNI